jgi:hypothetical protein
MSEEFDQESAFEKLWALWPDRRSPKDRDRKIEHRNALTSFNRFVTSQEVFDRVLNAVEVEIEDATGLAPRDFLAGIIAANVAPPKPVVVTVAAQAAPAVAEAPKPEVFDMVWAAWPENEDHPETKDKAQVAWDEVSMRRDEAMMVTAALHYVDRFNNPSNGMKHPRHLSNFIRDDDAVDTHLLAAAKVIPPSDIREFEVHWAAYPDFRGKQDEDVKKDSLVFWRRHVKLDERADFYIATLAYRRERRDRVAEVSTEATIDEVKFTKSMISFIGCWRFQARRATELNQFVGRPLLDACYEKGFGRNWGEWVVENRPIQYVAQKLEDPRGVPVLTKVIEKMMEYDKTVVDAPALAAQVLQDAYQKACKRAESMASSPGATSP